MGSSAQLSSGARTGNELLQASEGLHSAQGGGRENAGGLRFLTLTF